MSAGIRFMTKSCDFIAKNFAFFTVSSFLLRDLYDILSNIYDLESLLENDKEAIMSRITYVQNHESQLRTSWD